MLNASTREADARPQQRKKGSDPFYKKRPIPLAGKPLTVTFRFKDASLLGPTNGPDELPQGLRECQPKTVGSAAGRAAKPQEAGDKAINNIARVGLRNLEASAQDNGYAIDWPNLHVRRVPNPDYSPDATRSKWIYHVAVIFRPVDVIQQMGCVDTTTEQLKKSVRAMLSGRVWVLHGWINQGEAGNSLLAMVPTTDRPTPIGVVQKDGSFRLLYPRARG